MPEHALKTWIRDELWNRVPVSIGVINPELEIVEANQTFTRNYGEWRGQPCYAVYKGRSEPCERCAARATFADGQVRVSEERGVVKDGKQTYYLVHVVPLLGPGEGIPLVIEMSTDITQTKLLEQEKLEAERLAAVGQTVAGLAHGIKNILMGLDGGMYIARSGIERGDTRRLLEGWRMLEDNVARISAFTKEFLEFARGRTPRVTWLAPQDVARRVVDLFRESARQAGIDLVAELDPGVESAPMDEAGMHACLANLVSNALDACATTDRPGGRVKVTCSEREGTIIFEVADNGTGMDYEVKQKVFTNFFSTKALNKGTGLGLLTTRKIVQEHGGKVGFESVEGVGSTFRLEFPRHKLPHPGGSVDDATARGPSGGPG
jgi:signal transduction histidine kinase